MAISYKPLWHLLVEKEMSKADLIRKANITGNVVARMARNSYISMESVEKICQALGCTPNDVFEVLKGEKKWSF